MSGSGLLGGVGLEWALWADDDMTDNGANPLLQQAETEVWVMGDNKSGQLGLGEWDTAAGVPGRHLEQVRTLRRIEDASSYVVGVRCAENQTLLRCFDGSVHTCGENEHLNQGLSEDVVEEGESVFRLERVEIEEPAWVLTGSPQKLREAESHVRQLEGWITADEARLAATASQATAAALAERLEGRREQLQMAQAKLSALRAKRIKDWKVKEVRTSGQHSIAVSNYGDVFGWGDGTEGQLGYVGTGGRRHAPQRVRTPGRDPQLAPLEARNIDPEERKKAKKAKKDVTITSVACGAMHSALLTLTGQVYVQGLNSYGQLGQGSKRNGWEPARVKALVQTTVKQVSCGFFHTAFLTEARELYLCGLNNNGQLGMEEDGAPWAGDDRVQEEPKINTSFDSSHGVTQVACGGFHTAVLCNGGELYTFGDGREYQLGHGDNEDQEEPTLLAPPEGSVLAHEHIVSVECGQWCTAAVCLSGQIYEWGSCREQSITSPTPLGAAPGDHTPPPELQGRLSVSVGLGDQHCAVLCVAEPGAYHRAGQKLLAALMDSLHDIHKLQQFYYQPLLDKLNLAKPLMSRADLDLVFAGCDE
jgi:alpha-tubulin suppressor-like RCC1 family protein